MVYLATDKQTYADLSITETASNEQFLFSLFSKTETKEGKALMLNWIMYPLSDLEEIRKRQEAIVWDALPELLLNEEELILLSITWLIVTRYGKLIFYFHVLLLSTVWCDMIRLVM